MADLVAAVALAQAPVRAARQQIGALPASDVRAAARRCSPTRQTKLVIAGVFDPATLLGRIHRLFVNLPRPHRSRPATSALRSRGGAGNNVVGLRLSIDDRFEVIKGDVCLWLENDVR